jgi:cell division topological specificity factor
MSWFALLAKRKSASVPRERLQILLTHERRAGGKSDLILILREEVLAVVAKHVTVEPDKVQVKIDRGKAVSLLEIDIELPVEAPPNEQNAALPYATGSSISAARA